MSDQTVGDVFDDVDEFECLLEEAESNATTKWETDFIDGMRDRLGIYGGRMYLSGPQLDVIHKMARGE